MKDLLLDYDLQFFADGEAGAEAPEAAEPVTEGQDETPEETEKVEPDQNAIYAAARRRAEAEAKANYDRQAASLNARVADRFKGLQNPETGRPITTAEEYFEALDAQERVRAKAEMQKAGIDPNLIERSIANSPLMRQAEAAIAQMNASSANQMVNEDLKAIMSIDPTLTSEQDVVALPNFPAMIDYCSRTGARLVDAYKVLNFDRLMQSGKGAAQQAAINQAKGKGHLTKTAGIAATDESMDIPSSELSRWQQMFPDKSQKELRALYNRQQKSKGR